MGREIRRVPAGWQHPVDEDGDYIPLHDGNNMYGHPLSARQRAWDEEAAAWAAGIHWAQAKFKDCPAEFDEWEGPRPEAEWHTPELPPEQLTHWQYYESTSEGTPISPVFAAAEELARWFVETNGDDSYSRRSDTWTYEDALRYVTAPPHYVADLDEWKKGGWA